MLMKRLILCVGFHLETGTAYSLNTSFSKLRVGLHFVSHFATQVTGSSNNLSTEHLTVVEMCNMLNENKTLKHI